MTTMRCYRCETGTLERRRIEQHDLGGSFGLKGVIVKDCPVLVCDTCESITFEGQTLEVISASLALFIVQQPTLDADEVRYIRKFFGHTQEELAAKLKVDRITVGRWERGENPISGSAVSALRAWVFLQVLTNNPTHPNLQSAMRILQDNAMRMLQDKHLVEQRLQHPYTFRIDDDLVPQWQPQP